MLNKKTDLPRGSKKLIRAWTFYDWANSVYSLVISSAIFPIYYSTHVFSDINSILIFNLDINKDTLISLLSGLCFLIIAFLSPMLSGIADYIGNKKIFHTEYTFHIKPEHESLLWGKMNYEKLREFDSYIKSIPAGLNGQQETKIERQVLKNIVEDSNALMSIHPKVDSKKQRRVQCSFKIDKLIESGVEYEVKPIRLTVASKTRTFN